MRPVYTPLGWGLHAKELFAMCDYSLHSVRTRPAKVGDKLLTKDFGTGTRGFASLDDLGTAVCVLPGTELAFASEVSYSDWGIRSFLKGTEIKTQHRTAIFRQINKQKAMHHDALEFPRWAGCAAHSPIRSPEGDCPAASSRAACC
jgi:hypothetical protein